jgi:RNA polymerase sigma factor (sigma-70 family)
MRTEDGYIVHRCLNGEPEAFGLLIDRYKEAIYAFAYVKLRNFHDAEDVAQEVFIKAYRKLASLKQYDSFLAWLYSIASDLCRKWIRSQARRPDREFIEDQNPAVREGISTDSYREDAVYESLHEALDSLPETYQQVLTLYYLGGMSSREIARFVGASPSAVRMRLSRARAQLREEMVAIMSTAFEGQKLQAGFTFRIVEAVSRIKIQPMPRSAGLPWGLSLAAGIIITVLSLSPYMIISTHTAPPSGLPLAAEMKVLETGEIPVDVLDISRIPALASKQEHGEAGEPAPPEPQNAAPMAAHGEGGTWTRKTDMPTARYIHNACVVDGLVYVIGGGLRAGWVFVPAVEAYDPVADNWAKKKDMPVAKNTAASVVDGTIYAIGGWDAARRCLSTVEAYDPVADTWTTKADMPTPRRQFAVAVLDGIIYAMGGSDNTKALSVVEAYDPVADTWTERSDIPTARAVFSAAVVNGKIYTVGGTGVNGNWNVPSAVVEEYTPEGWRPSLLSPQGKLPTTWGQTRSR